MSYEAHRKRQQDAERTRDEAIDASAPRNRFVQKSAWSRDRWMGSLLSLAGAGGEGGPGLPAEITDPADDHILQYDGTAAVWKNRAYLRLPSVNGEAPSEDDGTLYRWPAGLRFRTGATWRQLATESFVIDHVNNLSWKDAVRAATTGNVTLSGTQTVDGVDLAAGDRVLARQQDDAENNGVYTVQTGAWTRAGDADTAEDLAHMAVFVQEGTANGNTAFVLTADGAITVGTTELPYAEFGTVITSFTQLREYTPADADGNAARLNDSEGVDGLELWKLGSLVFNTENRSSIGIHDSEETYEYARTSNEFVIRSSMQKVFGVDLQGTAALGISRPQLRRRQSDGTLGDPYTGETALELFSTGSPDLKLVKTDFDPNPSQRPITSATIGGIHFDVQYTEDNVRYQKTLAHMEARVRWDSNTFPAWADTATYSTDDRVSLDVSGETKYFVALQDVPAGENPSMSTLYWDEISNLTADSGILSIGLRKVDAENAIDGTDEFIGVMRMSDQGVDFFDNRLACVGSVFFTASGSVSPVIYPLSGTGLVLNVGGSRQLRIEAGASEYARFDSVKTQLARHLYLPRLSGDPSEDVPEGYAAIYFDADGGLRKKVGTVASAISGGGGNVPAGTAQWQHLETDGDGAWIATNILTFGENAADGTAKLRIPNDNIGIAWRNAGDDGNVELKVDATDSLDLTDSSEGIVTLKLRAQDADAPDSTSSWSQQAAVSETESGVTTVTHGATTLAAPADLGMYAASALHMRLDGTVKVHRDMFLNSNDLLGVGDLGLNSRTVSSAPSGNVILAAKDSDDNALGLRYYAPAGDHRFHVGSTNVATIGTERITIRGDGLLGLQMYRYTNPAVVGTIGGLQMRARNSEAEIVTYADIIAKTVTTLDGSEGGSLELGVTYSGSTDGMTFQMMPRSFNFELRDPTALGLFFDLYANSSSPANNDDIGIVRFEGNDDEGNKRTYGGVWCEILDVDADDPDGELDIGVLDDGTLRSYISLQGSHGVTVTKELSMNSNRITSLATPTAASDAATKQYVDDAGGGTLPGLANGRIWIGDSGGAARPLLVSGDVTMTNAGVVSIAGNTIDNTKLVEGTFARIEGIGEQTQDLDMGDNDIRDVGRLRFDHGGTPISTGANITAISNGSMYYGVPSNDEHIFRVSTSVAVEIGAQYLQIQGNSPLLHFRNTDTTPNTGTTVGSVQFAGQTTGSGGGLEAYAWINVLPTDVTHADRGGNMQFLIANDGSTEISVVLRGNQGDDDDETLFGIWTDRISIGFNSSAKIGFLGKTPITRPLVIHTASALSLAIQIADRLDQLGLIDYQT